MLIHWSSLFSSGRGDVLCVSIRDLCMPTNGLQNEALKNLCEAFFMAMECVNEINAVSNLLNCLCSTKATFY